jgi:hypothetical protein
MKGAILLPKIVVIGLILSSLSFGSLAQAQGLMDNADPSFNPNSVITDDDMFDVNGMNYDYLRSFLRSKGALGDLLVTDIDGKEKPAADVIWRVATSYKINPKYLLVLLQKEQSLVEDMEPSQRQLDWAAGYAICDSCSKNDPDLQQFRGFASQLEWAAKQHREKYLMQLLAFGATISGKAVGKSMKIDGQTVTPANNATAMLYTYTPHIHGNYNLWKIWQRWFSFAYPSGTIVRGVPSQKTYMIQGGQKREFESPDVLLSMADPKKILETSDTTLTGYPNGDKMRFPKYSLIQTDEGNLYLIASQGKRLITSKKVFYKFGFMDDDLIDAKETDLADLALLDPITATTSFPQGALVKTTKSSTVWYVENSVKHALPDMVFVKLYFPSRPIKTIAVATLEKYKQGDTYTLRDGELVRNRSAASVYVVEQGMLRPILSASTFEIMGYKWQNVVVVPDKILASYTISDPLTATPPAPSPTLAVQSASTSN